MTARRNRQRGAIALIVACGIFVLFGFAALAVDVGFMYTRSRTLQAIADSSVAAAMPSFVARNSSAATTAATNMALANGITSANTSASTSGDQLTVTVAQSIPSFFSRIFGISGRTLQARAVGERSVSPPALLGLAGCSDGTGVSINGNSPLDIRGPVESNGPLTYRTGPTTTNTSGPVQSPCAGMPYSNGSWNNFAGGVGPGGPFTDPFASLSFSSFPACTIGNFSSPLNVSPTNNGMDTAGNLVTGIYCGNGITVSGAGSGVINGTATFLSTGPIIIGANTTSTITAAANNMIAYTTSTASPAINLGNNSLTLGGSLYAPNGLINAGGSNFTVNGSIIGLQVFLGAWGPWTITPGGGSGGAWRMVQ